MSNATPRFALPFIFPGQAQKELFHNESLALADALLHPAVEQGPLANPPMSPDAGRSWLVAAGATGAWSAHAGSLATWTEGGWRFAAPVPGMLVWDKSVGHWLHWTGTAWTGDTPASRLVVAGQKVVGARLASVPSPSGGTVIDQEARNAIGALIVALRTHGLTE